MPRISVVIPTLNGGNLFIQVLEALCRQQLSGPLEMIVIDSGSTDGTVAAARAAGARTVEIPPSDFNHGLTRNRGIEMSTGDIVVLMTQDAVPADEALIQNLAAAFDDPEVAGAFARQIPRPEHDVLVRRNITSWIAGKAERRESRITDKESYKSLTPVDRYFTCVFDNVCSAVSRRAWEQHPFTRNAFGEDIEWSQRVLEAGWKIVYEPSAAVIHSHDRPLRYEYARTYMCHRTLYRLFSLSTVPSVPLVFRCLRLSMVQDLVYVWRHEPQLWKRLGLLARVPFLSWAAVLGQYRGARDERRGKGKGLRGV